MYDMYRIIDGFRGELQIAKDTLGLGFFRGYGRASKLVS